MVEMSILQLVAFLALISFRSAFFEDTFGPITVSARVADVTL